jgi:hypothetical protein
LRYSRLKHFTKKENREGHHPLHPHHLTKIIRSSWSARASRAASRRPRRLALRAGLQIPAFYILPFYLCLSSPQDRGCVGPSDQPQRIRCAARLGTVFRPDEKGIKTGHHLTRGGRTSQFPSPEGWPLCSNAPGKTPSSVGATSSDAAAPTELGDLFASSSTDKSPLWRWDAHFAILFPACHPFPGLFSKKARMAKPSKGFKPECYKEFLEMIS